MPLIEPRDLALVAAGAAAALIWFQVSSARRLLSVCEPCDECDEGGGDDHWMLLSHAHRLRRTTKPAQSSFRVTALVTFLIEGDQRVRHVVGCNDESSNLLNSTCAERAAFLQIAGLAAGRKLLVTGVYITTDSPDPITPGALCREYMFASRWTTPAMRVVMEGYGGPSSRTSRTLAQLVPHASVYTRLDRAGQVAAGARLRERAASEAAALSGPEARAYQLAVEAAASDARLDLHPVSYGAACVFEDGSSAVAWQKKCLEYGCSQDAVGQLAPAILSANSRPLVLCMADQFGVAHAPFATARALLCEHGLGALRCLCADEQGKLSAPTADELMPAVPKIF